jgi:aldose 1-epimerase
MIDTQDFGQIDGHTVHRYVISNTNGMKVSVISYGAITQGIEFKDKSGIARNMILGFDSLAGYLEDKHYIGAMVGRYANRIANARYEYEDESIELDKNAPPHQLHGGKDGLHNRIWKGAPFVTRTCQGVEFHTVLTDGLAGFPGEVSVVVKYALFNDDRLVITTHANTTKTTPVNITNHAYFTLGNTSTVEDFLLHINADVITPSDPTLIPTGELIPVENTPFDFREEEVVGKHIRAKHEQLTQASGYDHNFALSEVCSDLSVPAARVTNPELGIKMTLHTTKPGVQLYTGNFIHDSGIPNLKQYAALCLEPQFFPDSVNQPKFPPCWLHPNETYQHTISFKFENTHSA